MNYFRDGSIGCRDEYIYMSVSIGRYSLGVSVKCFGCSLYFKSEVSLLTFSFYDLSKDVLKSSIIVASRPI